MKAGFFDEMRKLTYIKEFFFVKADYLLSDASGNRLLLSINYKYGDFRLDILEKKDGKVKLLKCEAGKIAGDLIKRKSRVNFAANN